MSFSLNYNDAINLDAEELAEGGILEAYESLLPKLQKFIKNPAKIEEDLDDDVPRYSVRFVDHVFLIYDHDDAGKSWCRATVALFSIVNEQLQDSSHRFFAISGGNELLGIFLTPAEAMSAQNALPNKRDWPYLPKDADADADPWCGQYH